MVWCVPRVLTGDVPYKARTALRSYDATISSITSCHARASGEDVAGREDSVGIARPVGDDTAGLAHEKRARGDVPETEAELEEPVEDPGADVREVEARRAGPAQVLESLERSLHHSEVARQALLVPERESRGDDPRARVRGHREAASGLVGCPLALGSAPRRAEEWRAHGPHDRPAVLDERDAHPDDGKPAHEVRGAVDRIDDPHPFGDGAPGLLGEDGDVRSAVMQHPDRRALGGAVDLGDVVARALDLRRQRRCAGGVSPNHQVRRRRGRRDGELTQGFALLHPMRVRGEVAWSSSAGSPAPAPPCARTARGRGHPS